MPISNNTKLAGGAGGIAAAIALAVPLIAQWEGHRNHVYRDIAGVLTVCNGHTGRDIVVNKVYTDDECNVLLADDIKSTVDGVLRVTPKIEDKTYILASVVSFSYNIGVSAYSHSSVARDFNAGNFAAGCKDMLKYVYAGGKYSRGLDNRRHAEYAICMKGV